MYASRAPALQVSYSYLLRRDAKDAKTSMLRPDQIIVSDTELDHVDHVEELLASEEVGEGSEASLAEEELPHGFVARTVDRVVEAHVELADEELDVPEVDILEEGFVVHHLDAAGCGGDIHNYTRPETLTFHYSVEGLKCRLT